VRRPNSLAQWLSHWAPLELFNNALCLVLRPVSGWMALQRVATQAQLLPLRSTGSVMFKSGASTWVDSEVPCEEHEREELSI
jgi:hypothetical protein